MVGGVWQGVCMTGGIHALKEMAVDGMHPTGLHSSFLIFFSKDDIKKTYPNPNRCMHHFIDSFFFDKSLKKILNWGWKKRKFRFDNARYNRISHCFPCLSLIYCLAHWK